jgi:hypothetical protein
LHTSFGSFFEVRSLLVNNNLQQQLLLDHECNHETLSSDWNTAANCGAFLGLPRATDASFGQVRSANSVDDRAFHNNNALASSISFIVGYHAPGIANTARRQR